MHVACILDVKVMSFSLNLNVCVCRSRIYVTDTLTLLSFLRTAKFSQLKAREMIEKYATVVTENPRWFRDIDTCDPMLLKVIESR
jgi:hypothetical protein